MIAIAEPHWSALPSQFGSSGGLTLQLPAANAPKAATTPNASAILLSMDWLACFSKTWAWWKMQNRKTKEGKSIHCQSGITSSHVESVWLSLNSQRKAPLLIVAVNREFSGTYAPLVLESNICSDGDYVTIWFQLKIKKDYKIVLYSSQIGKLHCCVTHIILQYIYTLQ